MKLSINIPCYYFGTAVGLLLLIAHCCSSWFLKTLLALIAEAEWRIVQQLAHHYSILVAVEFWIRQYLAEELSLVVLCLHIKRTPIVACAYYIQQFVQIIKDSCGNRSFLGWSNIEYCLLSIAIRITSAMGNIVRRSLYFHESLSVSHVDFSVQRLGAILDSLSTAA